MTKTLVVVFSLLMVSASLAACAGFDMGDIVHVRTPPEIQAQTGLPSKTSLNEAESAYQAWFEDTRRAGATWQENIGRGNEIRGLLGNLTLKTLDDVGPTLAGVPIVGPAIPALTGLLTYFLGRSKLGKEKEASFNKGLSEGRAKA